MRLSIQEIYYALATAVVCYAAIRAILRWNANNKIRRQFVESMATNHLPHLYHGQKCLYATQLKIASALGIELEAELEEPPPINWAKVNGDGKH